MRKLIAVTLLLTVVVSAAAFAGGGKQEQVAKKFKSELKQIDSRLKLTEEQKTQIKTLLGERADKMDALYKEIEPREEAIRTEYRTKVRDVLTPAQQAEWDKMKGEYKEKWTGKKDSN